MDKQGILHRFANQINYAFDTFCEFEQEPHELSNVTKTKINMMMMYLLHKSLWDTYGDKGMTEEQMEKITIEIAEATKDHFKNLYGYDTIKIASNTD